jgi:hypothetical protein
LLSCVPPMVTRLCARDKIVVSHAEHLRGSTWLETVERIGPIGRLAELCGRYLWRENEPHHVESLLRRRAATPPRRRSAPGPRRLASGRPPARAASRTNRRRFVPAVSRYSFGLLLPLFHSFLNAMWTANIPGLALNSLC